MYWTDSLAMYWIRIPFAPSFFSPLVGDIDLTGINWKNGSLSERYVDKERDSDFLFFRLGNESWENAREQSSGKNGKQRSTLSC